MSVVRDSRSTELSQGTLPYIIYSTSLMFCLRTGHLAKKATSLSIPIASLKFTPVTSLSFSSARSKDWDDVLTAHTEESFARTWSVQNKKHGKYHLAVHDSPSSAKKGGIQGSVKAVHVTACGNFGMAANSAGVIGMWNMQSGIRRKTFKIPAGREGKNVVGLASDALNTVVIVATLEGSIHVSSDSPTSSRLLADDG
jgi:U3 small nucleolar RNA-associated protein 21